MEKTEKNIPKPIDIFGIHVFDRKAMKSSLPEDIYRRLITSVEGGQKLDSNIADFVASTMKEWAISKGATHYAHWFLPRTESTAEKHMAFLDMDDDGFPIESFRGSALVRSEPDASSFPSGGMRSTFEARGYSTWDPSSPAFIIKSPKGGTLCIPSVFLSYDGTPLDIKTPLLKSIDTTKERALKLLKLFGNRTVRNVEVTIGAEQEFYLVEETKARNRPDLSMCGRTIIGAPSPKEQTIEAHYFGAIKPKVLAFMEDVERDMYRLGQILMTRHNEAGPGQFEFAPIVSEANRGCDQNHILMEVMGKMATRHNLRLLLHEKPFHGINGSGKHVNFSLKDSDGRNLLKPSSNPRRNIQFLTFLSAFLLGMSQYSGLMRAAIASPGNMYRLGGHEAPPAIMSIYLGDLLNGILDNITKGIPENISQAQITIDLGLNRLPSIEGDFSDRNRTSPVAFTGNKIEFRGVGAPQAVGAPLTILLAIWSKGLEKVIEMIESRTTAGMEATEAALEVIAHAAKESANIRFEGNGYTEQWQEEASKRCLPICKTTPEALDQFLVPENVQLLSSLGIMSERETDAYHQIRMNQYLQSLITEISVMKKMMWEGVLPAISRQVDLESKALSFIQNNLDTTEWMGQVKTLAQSKCQIIADLKILETTKEKAHSMNTSEAAKYLTKEAIPIMNHIRLLSDTSEQLIAKDLWPYPTYQDLLHIEQ